MKTASFEIGPDSRLLDAEHCHAVTLDMAAEAFRQAGEKGRELRPMFQFVFAATRQVWLSEVSWPDECEKVISVNILRAMVRKMKPDHYSMMSEVWRVIRDAPPAPGDPLPADCADRQEALLVATISKAGRKLSTLYPILRESDGRRHLGPPESDEFDTLAGRMVELY